MNVERRTLLRILGGWLGLSALVWGLAAVKVASSIVPEGPPVAGKQVRQRSSPASSSVAFPDRVGRGETLSDVLLRNGFSAAEVHEVARSLSGVLDLRHLRAGDAIDVVYGLDGEAETIRIERGPLAVVEAVNRSGDWSARAREREVERRDVALSGTLRGNLFTSMARLGESAPLVIAFANIFAWDFDFYTESREGDRFALLVEKLYHDGTFIGYGELKAVRYQASGRMFSAYLYEDPEGAKDYYDPNGNSMRKSFLRAPLELERISSRFSYSRLHPVHKRRMPHLGVDYAARTGTPVFSVANGVVVERGRRGASGNLVSVRHANGYVSKYLHLSRFARGLRVGQAVQQKQVIGYVGATGTVTAPHLDFRLHLNGKSVNPLTQIFPPGPPVAEAHRAEFDRIKVVFSERLDSIAERRRVVD